MLHVQEYLKSKTLEDLTNELGIVVKKHDTLPLVILNYNQIESPKLHPIVRECRALVLELDTWRVVARSFSRFFNWGEVTEEMSLFDFSDFIVQSKEDGSLVLIYYFDEHWRVNTRGSFATDNMQNMNFTWETGICQALGVEHLDQLYPELNVGITYVCEFVSPWNKVVRRYDHPKIYLLTAFGGERELSQDVVETLTPHRFMRPERYQFKNMQEIESFLRQQEELDPTFEGVVIQDKNGQRWKIKNPCYLALHRLRGNDDNLFNPKNLLPFVMSGEEDEILVYFPEVTEAFNACKNKVNTHFEALKQVWLEHRSIDDQKTFALAIAGKTPFTGLLFQLRRDHGTNQTEQHLKEKWRESSDLILKAIFKNKAIVC